MGLIPDFNNKKPTPEFFRNVANAYHGAAKILLKEFPEDEKPGSIGIKGPAKEGLLLIFYPFNFSLAHSLEIYMKCYLLQNGITEDEITRVYRHDLEKLMDKCIEKGFDFSEMEKKEIVMKYNKLYKRHTLRYPKSGDHDLPNYHAVLALLAKFFNKTDIY